MWMDEFVIKLYDFRGIYRFFFLSQNSHLIVKKLL